MAYRAKTVSLSDAAELIAESLGQESGRNPRELTREARYELARALRDGAIEAEGEHIAVFPNDLLRRIEIRKVSRVWWAGIVVEPPKVHLWKPGRTYIMWSGDGGVVIGPFSAPPPTGHMIDGAIAVRRIRLEEEALLAIWPITIPSSEPALVANRRRSAVDDRSNAISKVLERGKRPGSEIPWGVFYKQVRDLAGKEESTRGWSDESIKLDTARILRDLSE